MRNNYEQIVRIICGDNWAGPDCNLDERDGGLGVAMMIAYISGVPARLTELSRAIDVPSYLLDTPYKRLQMNGLFSPRSWVLTDPLLRATGSSSRNGYDSICAWCYIAGYASGLTGKGFTREEYAEFCDKQ